MIYPYEETSLNRNVLVEINSLQTPQPPNESNKSVNIASVSYTAFPIASPTRDPPRQVTGRSMHLFLLGAKGTHLSLIG